MLDLLSHCNVVLFSAKGSGYGVYYLLLLFGVFGSREIRDILIKLVIFNRRYSTFMGSSR